MKDYLKRLSELYERFLRMQIALRSAALTFSTLLAVVPIVGLSLRYLQKAGITDKWIQFLKHYLLAHLNAGRDASVVRFVDQLVGAIGSQTWGPLGHFILLYATWSLITRFAASLDNILRVRSADERPLTWSFVRLTLRRSFILLTLPIILLATVAAQHWIQEESWMKTVLSVRTVGPFIALPLAWSADVIGFAFVYYFVPRRAVSKRSAFRAAIIVTIGLELSRFLLGLYNSYAVSTHKLYGIFATIPITLLWIQLCWILVLSGGLLLDGKRELSA